ncbi:MAG: hypothetical protein ACLQUY_03505 [Ktedonobacterales bacterium]
MYTGYVEAPYGTLAERMAVPSTMRLPLPAGANPVSIAGGLNPGLSSWMPLKTRAAEIGALAGPEASVPASLLRSRHIRILGSGAGSMSMSDVMMQLPIYMQLIAEGRVLVPTRTFPLSQIHHAWAAAAEGGPRVVVVPA